MAKQSKIPRKKGGKHGSTAHITLAELPNWDMGARPKFRQQQEEIEDRATTDPDTGERRNPNGVKGLRYINMLDHYYKDGTITKGGYTAGKSLLDAWCQTHRSKGVDLSQVRVDQSSKPDANIAIMIDRVSDLVRITKLIPKFDERLLHAVICEGHSVGIFYPEDRLSLGKAHLRDALDRLYDALSQRRKKGLDVRNQIGANRQ